VSQDNRNKTMFGRSPFFMDDDGGKVPAPAAPAAPKAPAAELGFDEDGWDFDEPSSTGSPAAVPLQPIVAAPVSTPEVSGSYASAASDAMPTADEAVSGVPMGQRAPEPESERTFAGTMRFRAEDLAGLAGSAASTPDSAEPERAFSGTMRLSRHEMDAALAAVGAPAPAASAPAEEAGRAFGGTMRFRPEDMEDVLQGRAERSAGTRATVEASPELAESLRAQTVSDVAAQADTSTQEAGSDNAPAGASPVSESVAAASSAGGSSDAPVPEPGRPVWGTIPIMIDDIPRLFAAREAEAAEAAAAATSDATPEAAPPVATDAPPAEFGSTIAMGTQDVLDALAKVSAASASSAPPASGTPAEPAASRAPLPPAVAGETAGLLRDLAPATKSATPPAPAQKTGPPVVAIALGAIVLVVVAVVLFTFVL
jgi:hypothetical protein